MWHHLSQFQWLNVREWKHLHEAAVKGMYERAFANVIDRAWVVSDSEKYAMRWLAGIPNVDVMPSGVDSEYFVSQEVPELPFSATFWGQLRFGPNVQGLEWFCREIWPAVLDAVPEAQFTIIGFDPDDRVLKLREQRGVTIRANLPDLRPEVSRQAVVALPMVSGGGIKNKLLEAASMSRPIVCTPRALSGLRAPEQAPLLLAKTPAQWVTHLRSLWKNEPDRRRIGREGRRWVMGHHTWQAAARDALAGIQLSMNERRR
jgi:glycosyltransferase involved in cell wall biosynthesis